MLKLKIGYRGTGDFGPHGPGQPNLTIQAVSRPKTCFGFAGHGSDLRGRKIKHYCGRYPRAQQPAEYSPTSVHTCIQGQPGPRFSWLAPAKHFLTAAATYSPTLNPSGLMSFATESSSRMKRSRKTSARKAPSGDLRPPQSAAKHINVGSGSFVHGRSIEASLFHQPVHLLVAQLPSSEGVSSFVERRHVTRIRGRLSGTFARPSATAFLLFRRQFAHKLAPRNVALLDAMLSYQASEVTSEGKKIGLDRRS